MKLFASAVGACALAFGLLVGVAPAGAAPNNLGNVTCHGGTVPAGVYQSLTIASDAFCQTGDAEDGVIEIHGKLTLQPDAAFDAGEFGTAKVWVQNNVVVGSGAFLNLGCGGPDGGGGENVAVTVATSDCTTDSLNGALLANQALTVIVHGISIRGDISINGGGGGTTCENLDGLPFPPFFAIEDSAINGAVSIQNLDICWMGFIRNYVRGNVVDQNNTFGDPDANEVHSNTINGALNCSANSVPAQFGDGENPTPNIVRGGGHGECVPPLSNK